MQIDLKLLEKGLALAEHGSFSRAADALQISQPGLSRSIKELEDRIGLPLFNRDRAGIEPTDFGRLFLQQAADVLARAGDLQREVDLAKGLQTGEITLGFGPYAAAVLAAESLSRFSATHPRVRLRVVTDGPAQLVRLLRARTVDLCVVENSVIEPNEDLEVVASLAPIKIHVVVRKGHPLESRQGLTLTDVLDYPYVQVVMLPPRLLKPMLAARRNAVRSASGPTPPFPAVECPTVEMATSIIPQTDAFTLTTLGTIAAQVRAGTLVPLLCDDFMSTSWSILSLRKRTMFPATTALAEILQRVNADAVKSDGSVGHAGRAADK